MLEFADTGAPLSLCTYFRIISGQRLQMLRGSAFSVFLALLLLQLMTIQQLPNFGGRSGRRANPGFLSIDKFSKTANPFSLSFYLLN